MYHIHRITGAAVFAAFLAGGACAAIAEEAAPPPRPLKIVATIFPVWDWAREVLGQAAPDAQLTLLLDSGVDLHSYQPTATDLRKIAECDLFLHVGGESDAWVAPALAAAPREGRRVLDLLAALGDSAKAEELLEGMEEEEHHHHGHDADHDDDDGDGDHDAGHGHGEDPDLDGGEEEEVELDEHVWLSLRLASRLVGAIADSLSELDPARAGAFRANAGAYRARLAGLDAEYREAVAAAPRRTLVVADRFPLRYLADDYGLECFAAFPGCSAETEASFKMVRFLAAKADETGARALMVLEGGDRRIAETVRAATRSRDQRIVEFDSLQSVTGGAAAAGKTYLGTMQDNLSALAEALQ